jgi:hypothetical protein
MQPFAESSILHFAKAGENRNAICIISISHQDFRIRLFGLDFRTLPKLIFLRIASISASCFANSSFNFSRDWNFLGI